MIGDSHRLGGNPRQLAHDLLDGHEAIFARLFSRGNAECPQAADADMD